MGRRTLQFLLVFALLAAACGSVRTATTSDGPEGNPDASPDASNDSAAPVPFACNGTPCEPLLDVDTVDGLYHTIVPGNEISPCCTSDGVCGAITKLAPDKCLPFHAPGAADPACQPFETAPGARPVPCCASDGTCGGKEVPSMHPWQLGCVSGVYLGQPATSCPFDPSNDCTEVIPVECDGPEDCPFGTACCAVNDPSGNNILAIRCLHSSCAILGGLCHAGTTCEIPNGGGGSTTNQCAPMKYPFLAFCAGPVGGPVPVQASTAAGEINCGDAGVCGPGQQCCLREPYGPYCGPSDQPCACKP
jgi:hypothetical protein